MDFLVVKNKPHFYQLTYYDFGVVCIYDEKEREIGQFVPRAFTYHLDEFDYPQDIVDMLEARKEIVGEIVGPQNARAITDWLMEQDPPKPLVLTDESNTID